MTKDARRCLTKNEYTIGLGCRVHLSLSPTRALCRGYVESGARLCTDMQAAQVPEHIGAAVGRHRMYMRSTVSWSLEGRTYIYDSLTDATADGQQRVYFVLHGVAFYPLQ